MDIEKEIIERIGRIVMSGEESVMIIGIEGIKKIGRGKLKKKEG